MSVTLTCPRCKSENAADQRFCQRCGFGLDRTGTVPRNTPSAEQWIGKTINDKYRVGSILGEGGFGTVFRVELLLFEDHKPFALKLLHPDLSKNEEFRKRFLREAAMAMELVHPNAIQVREFDQTPDGDLYFTMDYCPGEPLKNVLARESFFTINRAIPLVIQMLSVLEAAHAKEIIHRDLKPDNVFLVRETNAGEQAMVGDFGLAKSIERNNGTGRFGPDATDLTKGGIVGTPKYMSPEQARGEPLDGRSDLFSIGVILFEMITGELPPRLEAKGRFSGIGNGNTEPPGLQRLRELIPPNLVVPRAVLEVIARALEPRPAARFQSATEFRESLEALPTYTPTYIEPRRPRRKRRVLARLLMVLLLMCGGSLFFPEVRSFVQGAYDSVLEGSSLRRNTARKPAPGPLSESENGAERVLERREFDPPKPGDAENSSPEGTPSGDPSGVGTDSSEVAADGKNATSGSPGSDTDPQNQEGGNKASNSENAGNPENSGSVAKQDGSAGTPEPAVSREEGSAVPVRLAVEPAPLRQWVPYKLGDILTYENLRFSEKGTEVLSREQRVYSVERVDEQQGFVIRDNSARVASTPGQGSATWYWRVTDSEFTKVRVFEDSGELVQRDYSELRWNDDAPVLEWEHNDYTYRVEPELAEVRVGNRVHDGLLVVVATKQTPGGDEVKKLTYFKRGLGEVYFRSMVNGVTVMERHLVQ